MSHALVVGSSGILGWAVVDQILKNYPHPGAFSKVTALTNRSLSLDDSQWPAASQNIPRLTIVSGIDFTTGTTESIKQHLRKEIPDIHTVTQVFWYAYQHHPEFVTEQILNVGMFDRGFAAIEALAPEMSYVILPTGTKGYGIHLANRPFEAPFTESMAEIPRPDRDELFYYALRDRLNTLQDGKRWKWAEAGFVPHSNPFNLAGFYINFLSLVAFVSGRETEVPYPGHPDSWSRLSSDGGQDICARFAIHLAVNPTRAGNAELYNIADTSEGHSMADRWPAICAYFGLIGVPPLPVGDPAYVNPSDFMQRYADEKRQMESRMRTRTQEITLMGFIGNCLMIFDFHRHFRLDKARKVGFEEEGTPEGCWLQAFDRYAEAGKLYVAR